MKKINLNNPKSIKTFNNTCFRAHWHRKHKVRAKNYRRARRMLNIKLMSYKIYCAKNICGEKIKYRL